MVGWWWLPLAAAFTVARADIVEERCAAQRSAAAPKDLAAEAAFNPPNRCRGWPLLRKLRGGPGSRSPRDVVAGAADPALLDGGVIAVDVVACGNGTFGRSLSVFLSAYSERARGAAVAVAGSGASRLSVRLGALAPGTYTVKARLHFYGDDCDGKAPVYLGGSEPRCAPRAKCRVPRLDPVCDALARVPFAPTTVVVPARDGPSMPADDATPRQCRDGAAGGGHWRSFAGRERDGTAAEEARGEYTGLPIAPLVEQSVHRRDPKMANWRYHRNECAYHYFGGVEAKACLSRTLIAFVGDSLMRGLYATTVRLLGGAASDEAMKVSERNAGDPSKSTVFELENGAKLVYLSMWSDAELPSVKVRLAKVAEKKKKNRDRTVVVGNWGAEHSVASSCETVIPKFEKQASKSLAAVASALGGRIDDLVLASPTAMLARRNPGMSYAKAAALGDVLARQAVAARTRGAVTSATLLDLHNLTLGRFDDATLDGVHYGQTAATMGGVALLNILCERPVSY